MTTKNKIINAIKFPASVASVKTLVDGGIRVTFDLPEDAIEQAARLMECKRESLPLRVEVKTDGDAWLSISNGFGFRET